MNSYLEMTPKYLSAHKKNTKLTILSVITAVALVTAIFSMLDTFLRFEKQQIISDCGNYHIMINQITNGEASAISSRIDVEKAVPYCQIDHAILSGQEAVIITGDEGISDIFTAGFNHYSILEGAYPKADDEAVIEKWAADLNGLKLNDTVELSLGGELEHLRICGICSDLANTKSEGIIALFLPLKGEYSLKPDAESLLLVRFKKHVNISKAEKEIMADQEISKDRISHNERLLALSGQSMNNTVWGLYGTGIILFILVLAAAVTMICNTFYISVVDRVHQFGLLRCIGASQKQIRKLVRREGLYIALKAIPPGVLAGIVAAFLCSAILKFYNSSYFKDIPLFGISIIGIAAGLAVGTLTVFLASLAPAEKAGRISPVNAAAGGDKQSFLRMSKKGFLTRLLRAETALGVKNAVSKKKTLVLMSSSIAGSIILFLGFQVLIHFMYSGMRTIKPYTPDISLISESGLDYSLYADLTALKGTRRVYGRMFGYVNAAFDPSRLTDEYIQAAGTVKADAGGTFIPPEQSWLISYDRNQLKWAGTDLTGGTLSEEKLNRNSGIIAVLLNTRNNVSMVTADLRLGDKVTFQTVSGPKVYTVMGILRKVPFADDRLNLTTFITTEKLYTEITGDSTLDAIDIQLTGKNQEQTISQIRSRIGENVTFTDSRQKNAEITQAFLTMAVFMYGFVIVIAFISILNIINTVHTSISAKTRYIGVMRAVGMSGGQLNKMIVSEAGTYAAAGCIAGLSLGTALQKLLVTKLLSSAHMAWHFPLKQVIIIFIITFMVTLVSAIGPLKRIRSGSISEAIGSLQ